MDNCLAGLSGAVVYMNYILIKEPTGEQHLQLLKEDLWTLIHLGLKFKWEKRHFDIPEPEFLGFDWTRMAELIGNKTKSESHFRSFRTKEQDGAPLFSGYDHSLWQISRNLKSSGWKLASLSLQKWFMRSEQSHRRALKSVPVSAEVPRCYDYSHTLYLQCNATAWGLYRLSQTGTNVKLQLPTLHERWIKTNGAIFNWAKKDWRISNCSMCCPGFLKWHGFTWHS